MNTLKNNVATLYPSGAKVSEQAMLINNEYVDSGSTLQW